MDELSLTPLGSPLALTLAGTQLIEAGAGTGKTWNIAALVLRLVLETGLSIGEILVVTYTRAATGELRGRIRKRLTEALAAFETGQAEEDFLAELLERQPAWQARARLRLAIESFDTAAIYTIHGFCQRALAEAALAAGQPFERELVAEANELIERVARDVWRNTMAEASPLWAAWLIERLAGPAGLAERVRRGFGRLSARLAAPQADDRLAAERAFAAAYAAARELWRTQSEAILAWLACAKLNQQSYPAEKIRARSEALAAWFANDTPRLPVPSGAEYFGREKITERRTAPTPEPTHPFFAAMDALLAAVARLEAACEAAMRVGRTSTGFVTGELRD
ncbi:MAG: UvrD-helicase domain-containing protein [Rhodocyclaceae bacterium]|nr:UvrD-helicase domain-containing protein [Rhodocyclaceae bacterium]